MKVRGIHVVDRGKGFPILLGHSLGVDHTMWEHQIRALERSFRVVAADFRGYGASEAPEEGCTLAHFVQDVLAVADHLGLERFGYAGLSMGGMVGMRLALAARARVAALALLDTDAEPEPEEIKESFLGFLNLYRQLGPTDATLDIMMQLFFRPEFAERRPDVVARVRAQLAKNDVVAAARASGAVLFREAIVDRLRTLDLPTLVLVGADDQATPPDRARKIHQAIPGSTYVEIPDCAHLSALEQPERVSQELLSFFKRTLPC